jgi:WD40 repeat protein
MPTRLVGGMYAQVTPGLSNNVRDNFSTSAPIVGTIDGGTTVYVTSAPRCTEGYVWWQVQFGPATDPAIMPPFGYTAEGSGGEYWLTPVYQSLALPAGLAAIDAGNVSSLTALAQVELGLVNRLIWSPDSQYLAANSVGATWIYNTVTGEAGRPFAIMPTTNYTQDVAFSPEGLLFTVGGLETDPGQPLSGAGQLWKLADNTTAGSNIVFTPLDFAYTAAVSPDLRLAAIGLWDGKVQIADAASGAPIATLEKHTLIGRMFFSAAGNVLVTGGSSGMGGDDPNVYVWDTTSWNLIANFASTYAPFQLAVAPAGDLVAFNDVARDGSPLVRVEGVSDPTRSGAFVFDFITPDTGLGSIAFHPNGKLIAVSLSRLDSSTGVWASRVAIGDLTTFTEVGSISIAANIGQVAFSPDGTKLAIAYEDPLFWGPNRVTVWGAP